jgi:hypothetical protein
VRKRPGMQRGTIGSAHCDSGSRILGLRRRRSPGVFHKRWLVWEFDTNRGFETVNGVKANGGSKDGLASWLRGGRRRIRRVRLKADTTHGPSASPGGLR